LRRVKIEKFFRAGCLQGICYDPPSRSALEKTTAGIKKIKILLKRVNNGIFYICSL
jgi:hypothetical protein